MNVMLRTSWSFALAVLLALLSLGSVSASGATDSLKVVTTIPDLADVVREVGGDRVEVSSLSKGTENLHSVVVRPSMMVALNRADLFFLDDQRRRERERVARRTNDDAVVEALAEYAHRTRRRLAFDRLQLDRANQAEVANVDDVGLTLQAVQRIGKCIFHFPRTVEQALAQVDVKRCTTSGGRQRMPGVGVTVEELDGAIRSRHERIVYIS